MAGGENGKLWTQPGEFTTIVGVETMLSCRGIHDTKRRSSRAFNGADDTKGA